MGSLIADHLLLLTTEKQPRRRVQISNYVRGHEIPGVNRANFTWSSGGGA